MSFLDTLVYLVYGSRREYQLELSYSVLSAFHRARASGTALRIALIGDDGNLRPDLPLENLRITQAELALWTRGGSYHHAAKIHALSKALDLFGGNVALIDTDTYFTAAPARLFERIGAQRSLMHAEEGVLGDCTYLGPILERLSGVSLSYELSSATRLLNSGVIGLNQADGHLLTDALQLVHQLYALYPAFSIEQFALSVVLDRRTRLSSCAELVRHYYGYERAFMHLQIAQLFPQFTAERFHAHAQALPKLEGFPEKRARDRLRAHCKSLLRSEGSDYRFAYLACLSAHRSARRAPAYADVWAGIAVEVLRRNEFHIAHLERDFRSMRNLDQVAWASPKTRQAWVCFWQQLAQERTRGRLKMSAATSALAPPAPEGHSGTQRARPWPVGAQQ